MLLGQDRVSLFFIARILWYSIHACPDMVDMSGYRRSALSSRNSIHFFKKLLPLFRAQKNC